MNSEQREAIASWLDERIVDYAAIAMQVGKVHGRSFIPGLRELAAMLRAGEPIGPKPGTLAIHDTDNFGGDYPDEAFIAQNIPNEMFAKVMCEALVEKFCLNPHTRGRFYRVVPFDYKLQPGFEP